MSATQDPFAAFRTQQASTPPPATPSQSSDTPGPSSDPFAAFRGGSNFTAAPPQAEAPLPSRASKSEDPFASFRPPQPASKSEDPFASLRPSQPASSKQSETESESPTWYGKSWDWLNKPLFDLHREGATGFEAGAEDVLSGLTSPLSIGLTVGTLGSGTALRALGVAAKELPVALQGLKFLTEAGFTAQQAYGVIQESPRVLDALKGGDYETAKRLSVHVLANLGGTALGVSKAFPEAGELAERTGFVKPKEELAAVREELGKYQLDVEKAGHEADGLEKAAREGLKNPASLPADKFERFALRSRDVGEQGIPSDSNSQATMSPVEARNYLESRGRITGKPQELVRVDLNKLPTGNYERMPGPNGNDWVKFSASIPESAVELVKDFDSATKPPESEATAGLNKMSAKERGTTLGAISRFVEAGGDKDVLAQRQKALEASTAVKENYSAKERQALLDKYERAQNLTPEQEEFANRIRGSFEQDLERGYQRGIIRTAVENYISHVWEDDPTNAATNRVKFQSGSKEFDTNLSAARRRTLDVMFDGEMLGKKVKADDPIQLMSNYRFSLNKAIAARDFMERLQDRDLRAPDGRALVAPAGRGETIGGEENPATLINPKGMRAMRIAQGLIDGMQESGELERHLDDGTIRELGKRNVALTPEEQQYLTDNPKAAMSLQQQGELVEGEDGKFYKQRPVYGWETGDYRAIDHPAFRDWNYATNGPDGNPVIVKSDLRVHPDAAEFLTRAVGADRSPIRDLRIGDVSVGRKFLKISSEGKHLLLSLSPFHLAQEGLRAVMTGINPFGKLDFDLDNDAALQYGVVHGLTLGGARRGLESFSEGVASHSSIIDKIPGLRTIQGEMQHFLFDRYIPGLKARAYKSLFERYQQTYSDISTTEAAQLAAAHSNELFGGLNYAQMGRSMATQDFLRATTLAPDWLESEVRSLYRSLDPKRGAVMRQDIARISAIMFGAARVLNMLTTGQPHPEAPFGVVIPGKKGEDDKVFTMRTLPTDLVHAATSPREFIAGRVNPLTVRPAIEFLTSRDTQGRKVTPFQEARDFASSFVPIPTKALAGKYTGDVSNPELVSKVLGASVYTYRSSAEKLAQELASDRMPSGQVTDEQLAKHQRNIRLEDSLRNGNITAGQLRQQLGRAEAQSVIDGSSLTPLQARFKRLPLREKLQVYDLALPREKAELQAELKAARRAYVTSHKPSQRAEDPTWRKLQTVFGQ
jgi:hypothetical protein